jgi:hypothetical protein
MLFGNCCSSATGVAVTRSSATITSSHRFEALDDDDDDDDDEENSGFDGGSSSGGGFGQRLLFGCQCRLGLRR